MRRRLMSLFLVVLLLSGSMSAWAAGEDALENELEDAVQEKIQVIDNYDVLEEENKDADSQESHVDKVESTEELASIIERAPNSESFSEVDANGLKWEVANGVLTISGNGVIERNASFTDDDNLRESITSIIIGEGITEIGYEAFYRYRHLEEVSIPDSVRKIGRIAFAECDLLTSVTLPNGLTEIDEETFAGCTRLSEIVIPNSVTKIGWGAFSGCESITAISIPESVTEIGAYAFYQCRNLSSIFIPSGVTEIRECTFGDCQNLTEVTIPNSVTRIYNFAFHFCTGLTKVIIPDSVKNIGYEAFSFCSGLQFIAFQGNAPKLAGYAMEYDAPFYGVTATAFYPLGNQTYTEEVRVAYGVGLTWEARGSLKIILETTKNLHILGTSDTATITCNGELKDFVNVFVDGREVDKSNYILEEGSTILTFTAQYLNTLSVGKHAVTLNYTYGSVDTELIILSSESAANAAGSAGTSRKAEVSVKSIAARTGDNAAVLPWFLTALTAVAVGMGTVFVRKKHSICSLYRQEDKKEGFR